jgi:glycerol kinase
MFPNPGWVEHDPLEILENTKRVMREVIEKTRTDSREIGAIGITNQRETTVLWDKRNGRPVCNAIVWQCRRTAPLVERLGEEGYWEAIRSRTGLVPDAYFSGPKVWWALENIAGARRLAEEGHLLFGTVDTWLIWNLTGSHVTDPTNASRTMLFDIRNLSWDGELLEAMGGIPENVLPEVRPSSDPELYGLLKRDVLGAEVPVCGNLGDQQSALFGQGCFRPGDVKNTYGTGNFLLMNTGGDIVDSSHGLLSTVAYRLTGDEIAYALEGSIFTTGAAVRWLRDGVGIIDSAQETGPLANTVPDAGGVHLIPAFAGLGAPHWNMYARGAIMGLNLGTTRAHIVRATLEAEAFRTRDVMEAMEGDSGIKIGRLRVDGGGSRNEFTMQFQSDVLGIPVVRSKMIETTSLGAAFAAGLAIGLWDGLDDLARIAEGDRTYHPGISQEQRDSLYGEWRTALEAALRGGEALAGDLKELM